MARRIVEQNLSVRAVEAETGLGRKSNGKTPREPKERPAYVVDLERSIASHLGTKVAIDEKRGGRGKMTIEFYSHDDFERLALLMQIPLPR